MTDTPTDPAALCRDLVHLHRALGALLPTRPAEMARPYGPVRSEDRSTAAPGLAATILPTAAPTEGGRRPVPGSRSPLGALEEVLGAQEAIHTGALALAAEVRAELGHSTHGRDPDRALGALPGLLEALPALHPLERRGVALLGALWRRSRYVLDLDRRPVRLGPCPTSREDYAATWVLAEDATEWLPGALWVDGVCREYDAAASTRATAERQRHAPGADAVDVWRVAILYVRDPDAELESRAAAVRCPGCQREWVGAAGRRDLYRLLELVRAAEWVEAS